LSTASGLSIVNVLFVAIFIFLIYNRRKYSILKQMDLIICS